SYDEGNFTFKLFVYTEINGKKFLYNRNITSKELLFFKMNTKSKKKFMYGIAFDGDIKQKRIINETAELGVGWVRYFLKWNEVEPSPVNLTGLDPKNNSHVDIAMKLYDWSSLDDFIYSLINKSITPIIDIATGYDSFLPSGLKLGNDMSDLDKYIEHLYWHARTVVHRYNFLEYWQAENEINWWWAHEIAKWRIGKVWCDIKVKDRILETITKAIRDEGKHKIIFNFEVDLSTYLIEAFRYSKLYDILGIDFYPWWDPTHLINWGQIFTGAEIFLKVLEARIIGKDLIVMEIGYPSGMKYINQDKLKETGYGSFFGYNQKHQASYLALSLKACRLGGAKGYFWYTLEDLWVSTNPEGTQGLVLLNGKKKDSFNEYKRILGE
ncbi:MAG: hypothetical protein AB1779_12440, partial [Candidatus Thermoplasmatota archaeon]